MRFRYRPEENAEWPECRVIFRLMRLFAPAAWQSRRFGYMNKEGSFVLPTRLETTVSSIVKSCTESPSYASLNSWAYACKKKILKLSLSCQANALQ